MALETVEVRATYRMADDESPLAGQIEFELAAPLQDPAGNVIYDPVKVIAELDDAGVMKAADGATLELVATDATGAVPEDVRYRVTHRLWNPATGAKYRRAPYLIEVPKDSAGGFIDLADTAPAVPIDPTVTYVLQAEFETHVAGTAAENVHEGYLTNLDGVANPPWLGPQLFAGGEPWTDARGVGAPGDGTNVDDEFAELFSTAGRKYINEGVYEITESLDVLSNTDIDLHPNAVIRFGPTATASKAIFNILDRDNVSIHGMGTLDGNRASNPTTAGGLYGVTVLGSTRVRIRDIAMENFPSSTADGVNGGDGVYIGRSPATDAVPYDVVVENTTIKNCVRQGVSLIAGRKIRIRDNTIEDIVGNDPGAAVDIEPNDSVLDVVDDVVIEGNRCVNCDRGISVSDGVQAETHVIIRDNFIKGTRNTVYGSGVYAGSVGQVEILDNKLIDIKKHGVFAIGPDVVIRGNTITNPTLAREAASYPVRVVGATVVDFDISNNKIRIVPANESNDAIRIEGEATQGTVHGNRIRLNGKNVNGVRCDNTTDVSICGNVIISAGNVGSGVAVNFFVSGGTGHVIQGNRVTGMLDGYFFGAGTASNRAGPNNVLGNTNAYRNLGAVSNVITGD